MGEKGIIFNIQKFSLHDGPGIRTSVFLKGCPLRCAWCANPESQAFCAEAGDGVAYGEEKTVGEVMAIVRQDVVFYDKSGGGMTLTGGEPLAQPAFAAALLEMAKKEGIRTAVETAGAVPFTAFRRVMPWTDLFLFDVKHYDGQRHLEGTGAPLEPIVANLSALLAAGADVIARVPVIPGFNGSPDDARGLAALMARLGVRRAEFLPFHQLGEKKYTLLGREYKMAGIKALRPEDLKEYKEAFQARGIDCVD